MQNQQKSTTHFGYEEVPVQEKAERVAGVFRAVADKYDMMNDIMSGGLHRLWKDIAIKKLNLHPGQCVLDIAGGTGDLTKRISNRIGPLGRVILSDINSAMLERGRSRLVDVGCVNNVSFVIADAERLPFPDHYFDRLIIGFGLRNVTDKQQALMSMYRCLKPGGKLLVLEFSKPTSPLLNKIYDAYSFNLLPKLGKWIVDDADSYRYLAESIRMHPDQTTLKRMMMEANFEDCHYQNFCKGIVAMHIGYKY